MVFLLAACDGAPSIPALPWFTTATPAPAQPTVRIMGWAGTTQENAVLQQAIAGFETAHPDVRVQGLLTPTYAEDIEQAWLSDSPPDLFLAGSHQLANLVEAGRIQPIPASMAAAIDVPPNLASALEVDGTRYCWPRDAATLALYVNPYLFSRGEVELPTPTWTWEDFAAAVEAATDRGFGLYGLVMSRDLSRLHPFLLQSSTDANVWSGDDTLVATEFVNQLYVDRVAVEPLRVDSAWNGDAFGRGKAAMVIEGPWLRPYLAREYPRLEYLIYELPAGPVRRGTTAFVTCWVISSSAASPEAAHLLAAYLTSPAITRQWATASSLPPPSMSLATQWLTEHPHYEPFVNGLAYATPWTGGARFVEQVARLNRLFTDLELDIGSFTANLADLGED